MTKEEFLLSLPYHRKSRIYSYYLENNNYYDDLSYEFYEELFEEEILDIIHLLDCHSYYLLDEEWDIYKDLEENF